MAWTYSGDPANSTLDAIRFEIGDTNTNDQLLQDAEINYTYSEEGSVLAASARCCEVLARKFAREADQELGPIKEKLSQRSDSYAKLAETLRRKATQAPTDAILSSDVADAIFNKGMMDNEE